MITDERRLEQTRWAWINEYGPSTANELLAKVEDLRSSGVDLAEAIARLDPENPDKDYDGFCASRW
jgi:hypothetical protein